MSVASFLLAVFLLLSGPGPAAAQFTHSVSLSERLDSNIFAQEESPEQDIVSVVIPALELQRSGSRLKARLSYAAQFEAYANHPELNRRDPYQNLDGSLLLNWGKGSRLELLESLAYTPAQPESLGSSNVGDILGEGILASRDITFRSVTGLVLGQPMTPKLTLETGYQEGVSRYHDPSLIASRRHDVTAQVVYTDDLWGGPFVRYRYEEVHFEEGTRDGIHSVLLGVSHTRPVLSVNLSLGGAFPKDQGAQWVASLGLAGEGGLGSWKIRYSRKPGASGGFLSELSMSDRISGTMTRKMTRNAVVSLTADYALNHSMTGDDVNFHDAGIGLTTDYTVTPRLLLRLGGAFFRQDSDGDVGRSIRRDQVLISVTIR